mmetsp:Transcript_23248/g.38537  ORF Transcript_23248/g.38537 Transcript_23248/m.38537 type:complete len:438 (-) Transcript_23248:276-1589(-)
MSSTTNSNGDRHGGTPIPISIDDDEPLSHTSTCTSNSGGGGGGVVTGGVTVTVTGTGVPVVDLSVDLSEDNDNGEPLPLLENGGPPKRKADGNLVREEKRLKWEAKQQRKRELEEIEAERDRWIDENSQFCQRLTLEDVKNVKNNQAPNELTEALIPYFDLKVQNHSLNQLCRERFIAEGAETVRLLLQQIGKRRENGLSHVIIVSILVKPGAFFGEASNLRRDWENCNVHLKPKVFVADEDVLSEIAGFPVARGAMACGIPLRVDEEMLLTDMVPKIPRMRILALDGISNMSNMGSLIRCAAAFGIHAMVLSKDCCDPWYRRSVRVSMGYISKVPIMRLQEHGDLPDLIRKLRTKGIHSYAAVVDDDASLLENYDKGDVEESWCCVLGNEANGVKEEVVNECAHKLRIGMVDGVDSLSVSIAAGILLHGLVEKTRP